MIRDTDPSLTLAETAAQPTPDPKHSLVDAIAALQKAGVTPSPVSLKLAGCTLAPIACTGGLYQGAQPNTTSYNSTFPNSNVSDNGIAKLDYHLNSKHGLNGMLFIGNYTGTGEDHPLGGVPALALHLHDPTCEVVDRYCHLGLNAALAHVTWSRMGGSPTGGGQVVGMSFRHQIGRHLVDATLLGPGPGGASRGAHHRQPPRPGPPVSDRFLRSLHLKAGEPSRS